EESILHRAEKHFTRHGAVNLLDELAFLCIQLFEAVAQVPDIAIWEIPDSGRIRIVGQAVEVQFTEYNSGNGHCVCGICDIQAKGFWRQLGNHPRSHRTVLLIEVVASRLALACP